MSVSAVPPDADRSEAAGASGLPSGRIPSLDGLRALSILLVVIGHWGWQLPHLSPQAKWVLMLAGNGELGVYIFFVISGFLITSLLLKEEQKTGRIQIGPFYVRRAFRIWPALYTYLLVVVALRATHLLYTTWKDILCGVFFVENYNPYFPGGSNPQYWFVGHLWSLSVEEQFYLLWPLALVGLKPGGARRLALGIILASPFVRVLEYALVPGSRAFIPIMFHTRADSLMFGCLAALLYGSPRFQSLLQRAYARRLPLVAAVLIFGIAPVIEARLRGAYALPIGLTLDGLGIALILLWVIQNPDTPVGRLLNARPVVHLGLISYSLYLWQQVFLAAVPGAFRVPFPLNLLGAFVAAELSFFLVEQPFLRLRKRLAARA